MKTDENILVPGRAALMVAKFERTMQPNLPVACVLGPVASPVASGVQKATVAMQPFVVQRCRAARHPLFLNLSENPALFPWQSAGGRQPPLQHVYVQPKTAARDILPVRR